MRFIGQLIRFVHGEEQNRPLETLLAKVRSDVESAEARHGYIHDDHVGILRLGQVESSDAVFRFRNRPARPECSEEAAHSFAHDLVIIDDENRGIRHSRLQACANCARPYWRDALELEMGSKGIVARIRVPGLAWLRLNSPPS